MAEPKPQQNVNRLDYWLEKRRVELEGKLVRLERTQRRLTALLAACAVLIVLPIVIFLLQAIMPGPAGRGALLDFAPILLIVGAFVVGLVLFVSRLKDRHGGDP